MTDKTECKHEILCGNAKCASCNKIISVEEAVEMRTKKMREEAIRIIEKSALTWQQRNKFKEELKSALKGDDEK